MLIWNVPQMSLILVTIDGPIGTQFQGFKCFRLKTTASLHVIWESCSGTKLLRLEKIWKNISAVRSKFYDKGLKINKMGCLKVVFMLKLTNKINVLHTWSVSQEIFFTLMSNFKRYIRVWRWISEMWVGTVLTFEIWHKVEEYFLRNTSRMQNTDFVG